MYKYYLDSSKPTDYKDGGSKTNLWHLYYKSSKKMYLFMKSPRQKHSAEARELE